MDQIRILRAGVVEHHVMAEVMKEMQQHRIADEISDTLILVEHPEVVTVGPKAIREGVVVDGYPTVRTDRGGGITWHGPGQLVAYPIVKWRLEEQSIRTIIGRLEDWAIKAFADCGIGAYKDPSMQGTWVDGHKICSIGLSFLHWVRRPTGILSRPRRQSHRHGPHRRSSARVLRGNSRQSAHAT